MANTNMQYSVSLAATAAPADHFIVIVGAIVMEDPVLSKFNTPMSRSQPQSQSQIKLY